MDADRMKSREGQDFRTHVFMVPRLGQMIFLKIHVKIK